MEAPSVPQLTMAAVDRTFCCMHAHIQFKKTSTGHCCQKQQYTPDSDSNAYTTDYTHVLVN
eukprot:14675-Heterococcus_DN1.PRE.5